MEDAIGAVSVLVEIEDPKGFKISEGTLRIVFLFH